MRQIEQLLIVGIGMDGGHRAYGYAEGILNHFCYGREAVGGARGVGNDVVLRGIVDFVVHAEDDGEIRIGGGRGNDYFLHRATHVLAGFFAFGENAGGFDDDFGTDRGPIEFGGILHFENAEGFPVHGDGVVTGGDVVRQIAENGIVFQQMRERLGIGDVVHRDDLNRGIAERRAINIAADPAEPVDTHFYWHASSGRAFVISTREYGPGVDQLERLMLGCGRQKVNAARDD